MKRTIVCVALAQVVVVGAYAANEGWEARPMAQLRDKDGASKWWRSSWRTGDQVRMTSSYKFEGNLCVKNKDKVKWYEYLQYKNWAKLIETDHKVMIAGTVKTQTSVLLGAGPQNEAVPDDLSIQLIRSYECPMSSRAAAVIGLRNGLELEKKMRNGYVDIYEGMQKPELQELIRERWEKASEWTARLSVGGIRVLGVAYKQPWMVKYADAAKPVVRSGMDKLGNFASDKAKESYVASIERLNDAKFKEGGLEAKEGCPFYVKLNEKLAKWFGGLHKVDETLNFATRINELFMGKDYYIASEDGELPYGRLLVQDGPAMRCVHKYSSDLRKLPDAMYNLATTPEEEKASGVIARESLNVNAKLFDARQRKVGDVWETDGSILNNFLHPDLKGEFSGTLVMKYIGDKVITLENAGENEKKEYEVRHLRMVTYREDKTNRTKLEYREGEGFCMKYFGGDDESKSRLDIYVDKESGYVVKVDFEGEGTVEALPDLDLLLGWGFNQGQGKVSLTLAAEAVPTHCLKPIK